MKTIVMIAAVAASLATSWPMQASARPLAFGARSEAVDDDPPEGFQPRLSAASGRLCVKQCPNDSLPCDPPSYKIADGRCTTQWH